ISAGVARALAPRLGKGITVAGLRESEAFPSTVEWASVSLTLEDSAPLQIVAGLDAELKAALKAQSDDASVASLMPTAAADGSQTFGILMDVEMPVSVSFGRAQTPLKDVLKLTTGSIIELHRAVAEPVDVLVNGHIIAQGEVVVVEGNFGVRIQNVVSR